MSEVQKHFLWTMAGPDSSYSCLEIHICWKVEREARMEPPIQTEYFLSGGAIVLIFMVDGARVVISFCILSAMPGYIVEPLLDVPHDLPLGGGGEAVAPLSEQGHQLVCQVTASQVEPGDCMGQGIALIDGDTVCDTVTGVHHDSGCTSRGVQRQHSLDVHVHGRCVEGLKHDLGHLLPVGLGVERCLGQEDWVLLRGDTELVVEGVMPDLLHVVPVGHDAVLDGVLEGEDASLGLGLVPNVGVLLTHAHHYTYMPWPAHNRGEDSPWGIVSSKSSLAHAGAIVNNQSRNFVVTHLDFSLPSFFSSGVSIAGVSFSMRL